MGNVMSKAPSGVNFDTVWFRSSVQYSEPSGPMQPPCARWKWPLPHPRHDRPFAVEDRDRDTQSGSERTRGPVHTTHTPPTSINDSPSGSFAPPVKPLVPELPLSVDHVSCSSGECTVPRTRGARGVSHAHAPVASDNSQCGSSDGQSSAKRRAPAAPKTPPAIPSRQGEASTSRAKKSISEC